VCFCVSEYRNVVGLTEGEDGFSVIVFDLVCGNKLDVVDKAHRFVLNAVLVLNKTSPANSSAGGACAVRQRPWNFGVGCCVAFAAKILAFDLVDLDFNLGQHLGAPLQCQVVSAAAFVVLLRYAFFACAIAAHRHAFPHGRHQFKVAQAKVTGADIQLV
jgi:hypothetical protein